MEIKNDGWVRVLKKLLREFIPKETIKEFFDELPIHESLRGHDFILVQNNLRSNLCQMHDEFIARADLPALARSVIAGPSPVTVPPVGRLAG